MNVAHRALHTFGTVWMSSSFYLALINLTIIVYGVWAALGALTFLFSLF